MPTSDEKGPEQLLRAFCFALGRGQRDALFAMWLFRRAAALRWIKPFRAARSSNWTARLRWASVASVVLAFLTAVRSSERCARLRTAAARDLRMFFFAESIRGTWVSDSAR